MKSSKNYNMPHTIYKQIESPLIVFNNIQLDITEKINTIVFGKSKVNKLNLNSLIIFDDKTITLFGNFKLLNNKNELYIKVLKPLNKSDLEILSKLYNNFDEICLCFSNYLQMYERIANGYDGTVSVNHVNNIVLSIKKMKTLDENVRFLIPFKSKINDLVKENGYILQALLKKYEYIIKFYHTGKSQDIAYYIYQVEASCLDENKSIENCRYLGKDLMISGKIKNFYIETFVKDLFFYGQINDL